MHSISADLGGVLTQIKYAELLVFPKRSHLVSERCIYVIYMIAINFRMIECMIMSGPEL